MFSGNRELSVNGESKRGGLSLPSVEEIDSTMMAQVAERFRRRYTATIDPVTVILGCDDELRPGNRLASAGQWKQALDVWKAAKIKKNTAGQSPATPDGFDPDT